MTALHPEGDRTVFLREAPGERLLVLAARAADPVPTVVLTGDGPTIPVRQLA